MKILWVSPFFLHPTERGAQIRTIGILKQLHKRHEIHFAALQDPAHPEAVALSAEYCAQAYPALHRPPDRGSLQFLPELAASLFSDIPLAIRRYASPDLSRIVAGLMSKGAIDCVVCDFLTSAQYIPDLGRAVLFQHNVETTIWERHAEHAGAAKRAFFRAQARRMFAYERDACRKADHVIAVSPLDADRMRAMFDVRDVSTVDTGVDVEYFTPREEAAPVANMVFTGSMDWLPNVDGMLWFHSEILPLIRRTLPECTVTIAGRRPVEELEKLAAADPRIRVTGTVPDIRPYLWGSDISIVPLRIGGGTRLKVYESMAARTPVVSTTVGAEGLVYNDGENIRIADSPQAFADACVELLTQRELRRRIVGAAWSLVAERLSWDRVSRDFEGMLENTASRVR
jgi:glycosyltransferase involved in cell wall biosynthesis